VDLFWSIDGGSFDLFGSFEASDGVDSAAVPVEGDKAYKFYALAQDRAGNSTLNRSNEVEVKVISVSVNDDEALPDRFELAQNYPNPFNLSTVIKFSLPVRSKVKIEVYDILGRKVKLLVNGEYEAGKWKVIWNGQNDKGFSVSSGVYLYRMKAGEFMSVKKMILLK
jgi:hypothetical protein